MSILGKNDDGRPGLRILNYLKNDPVYPVG